MHNEQMFKFWAKIRKYADNKCAKHFGSEIKCGKCNMWEHQKEKPDTRRRIDLEAENLVQCVCSNCSQVSYWIYGILPFGLPMECDSVGRILVKHTDTHSKYWDLHNDVAKEYNSLLGEL